jgi:tetratricopeptide (TPR) repeat protein
MNASASRCALLTLRFTTVLNACADSSLFAKASACSSRTKPLIGQTVAIRGSYLITFIFVGFALALSSIGFAQSLVEVTALNQQITQLYQQGKYSEAVPLAERALAIRQASLGSDHVEVAQSLTNLGMLYATLGRSGDAEPLFKRSLAIYEKAFGPNHPDVSAALSNLANLYQSQGRYADAEASYKRSLAIGEKVLGPEHPNFAASLNNLGVLYNSW